jgi:hypothetical protein
MSYYAVKPNFKPGVTCGPLTGFQLPVRMISFLGPSELFLRLSRKRKFRSIIGKISVYFNFFIFICIALPLYHSIFDMDQKSLSLDAWCGVGLHPHLCDEFSSKFPDLREKETFTQMFSSLFFSWTFNSTL